MAPIKEGRKFERREEKTQSSPTNPKVNPKTSQKTNNFDIREKTVADKQTKK